MIYEYFILASLLIGSALVTTTIWSREKTRMRFAALMMFLAMLPILLGSGMFALGHPAPWVMMNVLPTGDYKVIGVRYRQDDALYVWCDHPNCAPFSVRYPWSNELADRMWGAMHPRDGGDSDELRITIPLDPSMFVDDFTIHPPPQRSQPPAKEVQVAPPTYDRDIE